MRFLLTITMIATCCCAEKNYGFNPIDSLTGKVTSVKEFKYKATRKKNGAIVPRKDPLNVSLKEYSPDRNLTLDSISITNLISNVIKYTYNDKGYLILMLRKNSSICNSYYPDEAYEYDATGKCIKVIGYNFNGEIDDNTKYEYKLDESGRVIAQYKFNKRGKPEESIVDIVYDRYDNRISQSIIDDDNDTEKVSTRLSYNPQGLITKEMSYEDGDLEMAYYYKYSPDGKVTEIIKTDQDTQKIDDRETFTYANDGKLIEHCDYTDKGSVDRKMYNIEYDSYNNWIYMVMVDDDNDHFVYRREIIYYP